MAFVFEFHHAKQISLLGNRVFECIREFLSDFISLTVSFSAYALNLASKRFYPLVPSDILLGVLTLVLHALLRRTLACFLCLLLGTLLALGAKVADLVAALVGGNLRSGARYVSHPA